MLYFVALMTVAVETVIKKSGICVWEKVSSQKWAVDSELRNFLKQRIFFQQIGLDIKFNLISIQKNIKLLVAIVC